MSAPLPLAILISGRGSNMQAIAAACAAGSLGAEVRLVLADRPGTEGIERAAALGLPTRVLHFREFQGREAFEESLAAAIDASGARLVVLAGFMRILTPAFTARYAGRLLNIHPSLLPKYPGLDTHARALAAGDLVAGASVHFVTAELDGGPLVLQAKVPVQPGDTPATLAARVLTQECLIYPIVIRWIAAGRLQFVDGHACLDGQALRAPLDLSQVAA